MLRRHLKHREEENRRKLASETDNGESDEDGNQADDCDKVGFKELFKSKKLNFSFLQNSVPKCEVLHVCVVCSGHSSVRSLATLVKSILFYRKHAIR